MDSGSGGHLLHLSLELSSLLREVLKLALDSALTYVQDARNEGCGRSFTVHAGQDVQLDLAQRPLRTFLRCQQLMQLIW